MTRIGTYGASQLYISRLMDIQDRMQTEQSQVTTGLNSTAYSGIASQAGSVINLENEKSQATEYISNNDIAQTKLNAMGTTLDSIKTSITNFNNQLNTYANGNKQDQASIQTLQNSAMNTMVDLQSYLGANLDGQYLFSGGRVSQPPVTLPASNLQDFQSKFDGTNVTFPTTRDGDLQTLSLDNRDTGNLSFDPTNGLIFPSTASGFTKLPPGSHIQVTGTTLNNSDFSVRQQAATSSAGTMLSETGNIGTGAVITTYAGNTLSNTATGNLSMSFNPSGQMVMAPSTANTLQGLVVGTSFTIHGSNSDTTPISSGSTVPLVGTNLSTYSAGSTAATGVTIGGTDSLVIDDGTQKFTYEAGVSGVTVGDMVSWVNTSTNGEAAASVDNQGRIVITDTAGASGPTLKIGGTLQGLLGLSTSVDNLNVNPAVSNPLYSNVNSQRLTSLTDSTGATVANVGDTLVMDAGAGATTFTVSATSTMTDLTSWIAKQDPSATTPGGAQVSLSNNAISVANNGMNTYSFSGTLATDLGLPGTVSTGAVGSSSNFSSMPGNYDGTYKVLNYNSDGSVVLGNNTDVTVPEDVAATSLSLSNGIPQVSTPTGVSSGIASFALSGHTVTLSLPTGGTDMTTQYTVGNAISISGTNGHDGTYTVSGVTANSVSYSINPPALRVSQLVQQTGRSDVTMTFPTTLSNTTVGDPHPFVGGTVYNGTGTLNSQEFGSLDYSPNGTGGETISSTIASAFTDTNGKAYPPIGTVITLASKSGVNDGAYEVIGNDGTNLTIQSKTLKTENGASTSTAKVATQSWYSGDTLTNQQQVGSDRQLTVGVLASDPAFEKAIRAMGILAQGVYGTAGGLENHPERVAAAQYLLEDAVQHPASGTPPYGAEQASDITQVVQNVADAQTVISQQNDNHTAYMGFLDTRIANVEVADKTQSITTLMADSTALQASYQSLARVSSLSLLDYLK